MVSTTAEAVVVGSVAEEIQLGLAGLARVPQLVDQTPSMSVTTTFKRKDYKNSKTPTDALYSQIYHLTNPDQVPLL